MATHIGNFLYIDEILDNVDSYDFCSSYPYVMTTSKMPMTPFRKCNITKFEQLIDPFAYIVVVRFYNIKCKYFNNFISLSKVRTIEKPRLDNGRIISAEMIEICLNDIDLKFIFETYNFKKYEFLEVYWSKYDYLPKEYIEFVLEKYEQKTKLKNVEGKEILYNINKQFVNSLYGMCCTNNIRDSVIFDDNLGWAEQKISNEEIIEGLNKEKKKAFLSFSWGVWITSIARVNLLKNVIKLDTNTIYCDTDSIKVYNNYDKNIIENYHKEVYNKIDKVCKDLQIDKNRFSPKDIEGKTHTLGLFELDAQYDKFITQGAKKYAYIKKGKNKIEITVAGVPKEGARALKRLEDFKDDLIFEYKYTNKNTAYYLDDMKEIELVDYQGNSEVLKNKYGIAIIPTNYTLGKSEEFCELLSDESSNRAIYNEGRI